MQASKFNLHPSSTLAESKFDDSVEFASRAGSRTGDRSGLAFADHLNERRDERMRMHSSRAGLGDKQSADDEGIIRRRREAGESSEFSFSVR